MYVAVVVVRNLILVATLHAKWPAESFVHPITHLLGALSAIVSAHLRLCGGGQAYRYMERLEVRNEQLLAEKERLLYDVQRGRPLDDDDDRSAIRRGLQAGGAPSNSPPPSLPPGAPSSTAGSSTVDIEQAAHQLQLLGRPSASVGPSEANGEAGARQAGARLASAAAGGTEEAPTATDAASRVGEVSEAGEAG